ncbi:MULTISPECIES: 5-carboxymethyl-2-hydroxymuconate Delta-isomerase [unclassified Streptomyces]|uniref:5-carboxymethyl-2-hydroxymuconate Delta-isomerase n=1 Tax=unclassified Streptomyces TaxID=2593676 RepID=UPI00278C2588|nr:MULTISPECIES: 5-carboxymethyl-2-hydroxymuconate delta isomerase [unclassified Streptomyces]
MPQITVDYSPRLGDTLDRAALATELHALVVEGSGSRGTCKTFFRAATETYVMGGEHEDVPVVHVEVALLPGRSERTMNRLSQRILALLVERVGAGGADVVCSVEVRPLAAYSLYPTRREWSARTGARPQRHGCTPAA